MGAALASVISVGIAGVVICFCVAWLNKPWKF